MFSNLALQNIIMCLCSQLCYDAQNRFDNKAVWNRGQGQQSSSQILSWTVENTISFKMPWIATPFPLEFSDLPTALEDLFFFFIQHI